MSHDADPAPSNRAIFLAALEIADDPQRRAFLDRACSGDRRRCGEIERLLAADDAVAANPLDRLLEQLESEATRGEDSGVSLEIDLSSHPTIDRYKLLEQIGEGGMGTVFMAQQTEPIKRKVALKLIKPGMDSREVIARFEAERQALAMMDCPHIARVLDAGTTGQGRPYFVMELVRGIPITDYCDENRLAIEDRLRLLIDVCRAVQHAHQKGIIHRDLKPSNVMVTLHDGTPVVKVIDFGVAKALNQELTEQTLFTHFAQMIGTPLYMSPEQAEMSGLDVDTRSDVYSLGVLLYELLTGTTPFDKETLTAKGYDEMRRIIREDEPPRPSQKLSTLNVESRANAAHHRLLDTHKLRQSLCGELDWIVMKMLEKDRDRRYESASAAGVDVQRYLNDEPVLACPPSRIYRLQKFTRRNRIAMAAATVTLLALVSAMCFSLWQATEAVTARELADEGLRNERRARKEAEAQRIRGNVYLERALDSINQMTTRVSDGTLVQNAAAPELNLAVEPIRKQLLQDALELYQGLASDSQEDATVQFAIGKALQRLTRIQSHLGDAAGSVVTAETAHSLFERLARDNPDEVTYLAELAECQKLVAWGLWHDHNLEESERMCRQSLRTLDKAFGQNGRGDEQRAKASLILAYVLNLQGRFGEAEPLLQVILPVFEANFQKAIENWWELAVTLEQLGVAAKNLQRLDDAEANFRASRRIAEIYLGETGDAAEYVYASQSLDSKSGVLFFVALSYRRLGDLQRARGNLAGALDSFQEQRRVCTTLVENNPQVPRYNELLLASEWRIRVCQSAIDKQAEVESSH